VVLYGVFFEAICRMISISQQSEFCKRKKGEEGLLVFFLFGLWVLLYFFVRVQVLGCGAGRERLAGFYFFQGFVLL
jgi:hypothetical protein